jgi:hypothetical protein
MLCTLSLDVEKNDKLFEDSLAGTGADSAYQEAL